MFIDFFFFFLIPSIGVTTGSCLVDVIKSYLRNDSLDDVATLRAQIYWSLFGLLRALSSNPIVAFPSFRFHPSHRSRKIQKRNNFLFLFLLFSLPFFFFQKKKFFHLFSTKDPIQEEMKQKRKEKEKKKSKSFFGGGSASKKNDEDHDDIGILSLLGNQKTQAEIVMKMVSTFLSVISLFGF